MTNRKFLPLLAYNKPIDLKALRYPLAGSYKYDGFRALVWGQPGSGKAELLSRSLKPIPNHELQLEFGRATLLGLDGELVYGSPRDATAFNQTMSVVASEKHEGSRKVRFFVFDHFHRPERAFRDRYAHLMSMKLPFSVVRVSQRKIVNHLDARDFLEHALESGYEGIMLRSWGGVYKHGRSTLDEQCLLKVKVFEDSEAVVLEVRPRMHNANKQERDERGYAKRSTKKEGKVPMAEVGVFFVRDLETKKEFECGPGFMTKEEREDAWKHRHLLKGKTLKYRFQPAGMKELPRFPRFIGWRSRIDF
jgi:DNA ligase-1